MIGVVGGMLSQGLASVRAQCGGSHSYEIVAFSGVDFLAGRPTSPKAPSPDKWPLSNTQWLHLTIHDPVTKSLPPPSLALDL